MGRAGRVKTWCASARPNSGARAGRKQSGENDFEQVGVGKICSRSLRRAPRLPARRRSVTCPRDFFGYVGKWNLAWDLTDFEWPYSHSAVEELQCLYRERNGNGLPGVKSVELHSGGRPARTNPLRGRRSTAFCRLRFAVFPTRSTAPACSGYVPKVRQSVAARPIQRVLQSFAAFCSVLTLALIPNISTNPNK